MRRQNKKHRKIKKHKSGPNFSAQHFLHNPKTIKRFMQMIRLHPEDTVMDIGAGKGSLTIPLAGRAGRVIAVENDGELAKALREKTQAHPQIKVICCDIRTMKLPVMPFCVVANIPFSITTAILDKLLGPEGQAFQRGAFIMERGAAKRFSQSRTVDPRLLTWRMFFNFDMGEVVSRLDFSPPPRVDAAMIQVVRREQPLIPFKEGRRFKAFAAQALRDPQWMTADALRGIFTPAQLKVVLRTAEIDRSQSIGSLKPKQWAVLFHSMLRHVAPIRWPKG